MGIGKKYATEDATSAHTGKEYQKRLAPRTPAGRPLTTAESARLSSQELARLNAERPPSEQVGYERCPAPVSRAKPELGTCVKPLGWGTSHPGYGYCKLHGGNTRAGRKSAARSYGRELIETTRFGGDLTQVDITPEQAILEEVRRSTAMVRWLEGKIAGWRSDPENPQSTPDLNGLPQLMDETGKGTATFTDQREWLLLYREERAHMLRASKMAIDVGIAERMVTIAESQAQTLADAIREILDALSLTQQQHVLVATVVPRVLRSIEAKTYTPATPESGPPDRDDLPEIVLPSYEER